MPTIFRAAGFRFMIYVHDHAPPHVHIQGHQGVIEIALQPLALRAVRGKISDSKVREAMKLAKLHLDELLNAWKHHHD